MKITLLLPSLLLILAPCWSVYAQDDMTEVDPAPPPEDQVVPVAEDGDADVAGPAAESAGGVTDSGDDGEPDGTTSSTQEPPELGDIVGPASSRTEEEELLAQFRRFKELLENNSIDEADAVAKRIVELAIRTSGPRSIDTAKALTNLAIVQHRTEQYDAAIQNYEGSIEIIEDQLDRLDAQLINPLKGLGAAQLANGQPDLAAATFTRAVHISHVNEGPHNIDQVPILESLAETNLLLGELDQARNVHELIYNLNERHYRTNMLDLVPSLMRRARWQHRTGYYNDERATWRRIIRIIEEKKGKEDLALIDPYIELGRSYYYIDTTDDASFAPTSSYNAEIYFKRAVRIAEENPEATWMHEADTKLALGDYYVKESNLPSARRVYSDVWALLSDGDEKLAHRARTLEQLNALVLPEFDQFAGDASRSDLIASDIDVREGIVTLSFSVSKRGSVEDVEVIEFRPEDFPEMLRHVQRQLRARLYRPRHEDGEPVDTVDQVLTHSFYYRVDEMERRRAEQLADEG
jgi:tetratricopeptide (TPR) repeat protein